MHVRAMRGLQQVAKKQRRLTNQVNRVLSGRQQVIRKAYSAGLGDSGVWGDIGKVFVSNVSTGIANRIGGHAPASVTIMQPQKEPGFPKWVPFAAAGAGVLGLVMLLKR